MVLVTFLYIITKLKRLNIAKYPKDNPLQPKKKKRHQHHSNGLLLIVRPCSEVYGLT